MKPNKQLIEERALRLEAKATNRALQAMRHLSNARAALWEFTCRSGPFYSDLQPEDAAALLAAQQQAEQALRHVSAVHDRWLRKVVERAKG